MPSLDTHQLSFERQKQRAMDIVRLLSIYIDILDSYVIEFFSENLWEKVPRAWQATLSALTAPQLASLLLGNKSSVGQVSVWPLSLLAFKAAAHGLALPRQPRGISPSSSGAGKEPEEFQDNRSQSSKLSHLFRRHVKPKKQHEIRRLGRLVKRLCDATGCRHVVDIGSGQGHLSRYLAFGHGLHLTGMEASERLVVAARMFDREMLVSMQKEASRQPEVSTDPPTQAAVPVLTRAPRHLVRWVDPGTDDEDLPCLLELGEPPTEEQPGAGGSGPFVLTGLHACGDLGPAALRRFARCPRALGLAAVSCCYMKADTSGRDPAYPMSAWVRGLPSHQLPYKLRETACHAVEDFAARLEGQSAALRTHCYRAALEVIVRQLNPALKRPALPGSRKGHLLPFHDYARAGLQRLGLDPGAQWDMGQVQAMLEQEGKVLAYFCLSLTLAPAIETLILLDRVIYLQEQGFQCQLLPLFEPRFSPRNFVLVAAKIKGQLGRILCPGSSAEP